MLRDKVERSIIHQKHEFLSTSDNRFALTPGHNSSKKSSNFNVLQSRIPMWNLNRIEFNKCIFFHLFGPIIQQVLNLEVCHCD